jgi:RimJ/RimL family protein N-acetyltransferase
VQARWINDPSPIWDLIKIKLTDSDQNIATEGLFIGVFDQEKMAGAFLVRPWTEYCYDISGGVSPEYWGRGKEVCHAVGGLIFQQTPCLKIVAIIPEFNRLMIKCVKDCGMKEEGILTSSFMKHFKMYDQYIYGITKGEYQ